MEAWKQATEAFTKEWEQQAARWWDTTLRDQGTLEQMRSMLDNICAAKERSDQTLEQVWAAYRLPSATDIERLNERLGDIEDRLGRFEDAIETLLERLPAPASKAKTA